MPTQGERSGVPLKDPVLFSHLLSHNNIADTFSKYVSVCKPHTAGLRRENVKEMGWLQCKIQEWIAR